ncbi:MAG: DUF402 domain-containing protein, partial [Anaerolineales bacterium]|nr:DUF402 domain-containing protein [Anaerolineales bacterium]
MTKLTVRKLNYLGRETWRYSGELVERGENYMILKAYYDRLDEYVDDLLLRKGDLFIETYYTDRWYNIFEIYDVSDGNLKGWYCNIGLPAKFENNEISYRDLALDLLIYPDGRQAILDMEEFKALPLPKSVQ